jgi:hypothetical protein
LPPPLSRPAPLALPLAAADPETETFRFHIPRPFYRKSVSNEIVLRETSEFDVENLASHEFGHVAALGHVNAPKAGACRCTY